MQLVCKHDPHNPDHLVCSAKWSAVDIFLLVGAVVLVVGSVGYVWLKGLLMPAFGVPDTTAELNLAQALKPFANDTENLQYSGQSDVYLESEALYFSKEGEQIGLGPWPLEEGKETKVKVFLKLVARPHDVNDLVTVTGKLGPNAQWTGFAPIGQGLSYEPSTRTVRWNIQDGKNAVFEVGITPTNAQTEEKHLVVMDMMTISPRDASGRVITRVLTPDILLLTK